MKQTQNLLTIAVWLTIAIALGIVAVYETDAAETGVLAANNNQTEFVVTTVMELLTLAIIPLALRLFKFHHVNLALAAGKANALRFWGLVRILLLGIPLEVNTLLYYLYMNTAFGYLAIILALCIPFVYPTSDRCMAETATDVDSVEKDI